MGCSAKESDWCGTNVEFTQDGAFPSSDECRATATNIEGTYYLSDAPERNNLDIFGDEGTPLSFSGTVLTSDCSEPIPDA